MSSGSSRKVYRDNFVWLKKTKLKHESFSPLYVIKYFHYYHNYLNFLVICKLMYQIHVHTCISVTNQYSVDKATTVKINATNVVTRADRARTTFMLAICALCFGSQRLFQLSGILKRNHVDIRFV